MRSLHFVVLILIILKSGFSQKLTEPDKIKTFNITVNHSDYTIKTQILKDRKVLTSDMALTYYWYTSQKIMETKGGYDGKLLHGYYHSFYLNDQLRESGTFKYGIKTGEWKSWYVDGKLKEIAHWKKGKKNGQYIVYNDLGLVMAKGSFKNDLLHGAFYTYDNNGKIAITKKYKKGKEILPKTKKEKDKTKLNLEKKKKIRNKKKSTNEKNKPAQPESPDTSTEKTEKKSLSQKIKSVFKRKSKNSTSPVPTKSITITT